MGPLDTAAVIYSFSQDLGQELTSDRDALHAAVERFYGAAPPAMDGTPSASLILVRGALVTGRGICPESACEGLSDHLPIWATIDLGRTSPTGRQ